MPPRNIATKIATKGNMPGPRPTIATAKLTSLSATPDRSKIEPTSTNITKMARRMDASKACTCGPPRAFSCAFVTPRVAPAASRRSRVVAIAIRFLRQQSPGMRLIVSFADPEQGHHGGIYQAGGWIYIGTSEPQKELVIDGRDTHKRSAHAIWGTASLEKLRRITGLHVEFSALKFKHTYLLPLDQQLRDRVAPLAQPYPKRPKWAMTGDQPEQRRFDTDPGAPSHNRPAPRRRWGRRRATVKARPKVA